MIIRRYETRVTDSRGRNRVIHDHPFLFLWSARLDARMGKKLYAQEQKLWDEWFTQLGQWVRIFIFDRLAQKEVETTWDSRG